MKKVVLEVVHTDTDTKIYFWTRVEFFSALRLLWLREIINVLLKRLKRL